MKRIIKLEDFYSEKIWGYEKWHVSTHRNGASRVQGTDLTLAEALDGELPILIKTIKANDKLSVQVHPDDHYAKAYENDNGKTECWYILEAEEGATLICGIKQGMNKEKLKTIILENKIEDYLERIPVKKGDMIYIPAGTVHAIEGGITLLEVQQSSDVTYRLYDWGRDREMHIEKALDVINYEGNDEALKIEDFTVLKTPYFTVQKLAVSNRLESQASKSFECYMVIGGTGKVTSQELSYKLKAGETIYIEEGTHYTLEGEMELVQVSLA